MSVRASGEGCHRDAMAGRGLTRAGKIPGPARRRALFSTAALERPRAGFGLEPRGREMARQPRRVEAITERVELVSHSVVRELSTDEHGFRSHQVFARERAFDLFVRAADAGLLE